VSILITGIHGQDGQIISNKYGSIGERVFGISRHDASHPKLANIQIEKIDIGDTAAFTHYLNELKPHKIFHLAASHANSTQMQLHGEKAEFEMNSVHVAATRNLLEWMKSNPDIETRLVVALSSQMYTAHEAMKYIDEQSPTNPSTKYGKTKSRAYELVKSYRQNYGVYASGAILFNHASRYSKKDFVLNALANQIFGVITEDSNQVELRDFEAKLDISAAENVCNAMVNILNLEEPEDFVLANGIESSLRDITTDCLEYYNVTRRIELISTNRNQDSKQTLVGNSQKAQNKLNWKPNQDPLEILVDLIEDLKKRAINV
jgi:GDPmannose 4,6-dehydratase